MRLVLDTNIVVSGFFWGGNPAQLLDAAQIGEIELYTSRPLLAELSRILSRRKFAKVVAATGLTIEDLVLDYVALATVVAPAQVDPVIARDPADDAVLACALAANADLIVSGDKHLLDLGGTYQGIRIVTPAEAVQLVSQ